MPRWRALMLATVLGACTVPPPDAYVRATRAEIGIDLGANATGEACRQVSDTTDSAEIYCDPAERPIATIRIAATGGDLGGSLTNSDWRQALDLRFACEPPAPIALAATQTAQLLRCTRRTGGWPHVALIASLDGKTYFADGIPTTLPVIERAILVLSGRLGAEAAPRAETSEAMRALIERLAARAFTVGDVSEYYKLMALGARANLSEDFRAASTAYRGALKLQQRALGDTNPNTSEALVSLALQLSNQGQFGEAEALFTRAGRLAPFAADRAASARLLHYRALDLLNQGEPAKSLSLLTDAEHAYAAIIPQEAFGLSARGGQGAGIPSQRVLVDPDVQSALLGLIEVLRQRSIALLKAGDPAAARVAIHAAERIASSNALLQPIIGARVSRTAGQINAAQDQPGAAADRFASAANDFRMSLPLTRPFAVTVLLRAAVQWRAGDGDGTLAQCRDAVRVLRRLKLGVELALLEPCLDALAMAAERTVTERQARLAEMFEVAQLGQGSVTSQLIAQAAARLQEGAKSPQVAEAIRKRQDASETLNALYRTRDALASAAQPGALPYDGAVIDPQTLDQQIRLALEALGEADAIMQVAAPHFGQLVQQVVSAEEAMALLRPGEALAQVTVGSGKTWTLVLRDGSMSVGSSDTGVAGIARQVVRLRATLAPGDDGMPPPFAISAAQAVYAATLGPVSDALAGAGSLVVVPSGPLLSLPFGLLLTGPADAANLRAAPWLLRRMDIAHVPAAANFVGLRRAAGGSRARRPWIGFGDFRPVSATAAARSFPGTGCADTATAFAALPPLPGTRQELQAARAIMGARDTEIRLGADFTAEAVRHAALKDYRLIHIASHALLPGELDCQPQPLVVTSAPRNAANADGAMFLADDALALDLDADAVILSACNSGGRGGKLAGESLSGLARAFFYAGARALLATHWSLNDAAGERLVSGMLKALANNGAAGTASSLRAAQLALLDSAGQGGIPQEVAHPYFWAPMALIGEGAAAQTRKPKA